MKFINIIENDFWGKCEWCWDADGRPAGFGYDEELTERKRDDLHDSLYDCAGIKIMQGDDGCTYGVEMAYLRDALVPGVWQKISGYKKGIVDDNLTVQDLYDVLKKSGDAFSSAEIYEVENVNIPPHTDTITNIGDECGEAYPAKKIGKYRPNRDEFGFDYWLMDCAEYKETILANCFDPFEIAEDGSVLCDGEPSEEFPKLVICVQNVPDEEE